MPGGVIGRPRGMLSVAGTHHSMSCALPCQPFHSLGVSGRHEAGSWTELAHDWAAMTRLKWRTNAGRSAVRRRAA